MTAWRSLSVAELLAAPDVVLIDCEFTCWSDSQTTGWGDTSRPPELLEVGLAHYVPRTGAVGPALTSLVRPRINPTLSDYCRDLIGVSQHAVDAAPPPDTVLAMIERWLADLALRDAPTCGWGPMDREVVAAEAARAKTRCPFRGRAHADAAVLCGEVLGGPQPRDVIRERWGLGPNAGRHRALQDAVDLAQFCTLLRRIALAPGGEAAGALT